MLFRSEAAVRNHVVQKRLYELNSAGALEVDLAAAEVVKNQAREDAIKATVGKCVIVAPFSGRVADQKLRDQQFAQAGQPILDILEDENLELEFLIPSAWLTWMKKDHWVNIAIDETGRRYRARVTGIGARIEPISQSVKVIAEVSGRHPELIAGMSGSVTVDPPQ